MSNSEIIHTFDENREGFKPYGLIMGTPCDETARPSSTAIMRSRSTTVFIAQNYMKPIKVAEIGEAIGLHPEYANSIFKNAFGLTLWDYVIEERISHAQRKLLTTDLSITEIAFECGFNTISRFNAAFPKINRCTPIDFRKNGMG